ncbi:MAG: hypothetical protein PHW82_03480 [Bacteroidales bacterium]|nr:hypothetical protein [Bacteroidales bacterium]
MFKSNVLDVISNIVLIDRGIEIKQKQKEISLWFFKTDKDALSEFFETIALFSYLEKNDLIFIHSNYNSPNQGNFVSKNITPKTLSTRTLELAAQPIPTNIYEYIIRYKDSYLFVGTELKKLVKNDFKTNEQINHEAELGESKKQTKISKYSFFIAFVALIFSLLAPFAFNTRIDENQINSIKQELKNGSGKEILELKQIRKDLIEKLDSIESKKAQAPNKM